MGLHWYVFANLKRVLKRDYPKLGRRLVRISLSLFLIMDSPFLFLYFQGSFHSTLTLVSHVLVYPFLVWQTIMLMWVIILLPFTLWRRTKKIATFLRNLFDRTRKRGEPFVHDEIALESVTK